MTERRIGVRKRFSKRADRELCGQFVGNRYVYGGTSLTNGTDCSGFTMSVMAKFGVSAA